MRIKLYSARELDKKFPSGYWNGCKIITKTCNNKQLQRYYGIYRWDYKRLSKRWHNVSDTENGPIYTVYHIDTGHMVPKCFVKGVKQ